MADLVKGCNAVANSQWAELCRLGTVYSRNLSAAHVSALNDILGKVTTAFWSHVKVLAAYYKASRQGFGNSCNCKDPLIMLVSSIHVFQTHIPQVGYFLYSAVHNRWRLPVEIPNNTMPAEISLDSKDGPSNDVRRGVDHLKRMIEITIMES